MLLPPHGGRAIRAISLLVRPTKSEKYFAKSRDPNRSTHPTWQSVSVTTPKAVTLNLYPQVQVLHSPSRSKQIRGVDSHLFAPKLVAASASNSPASQCFSKSDSDQVAKNFSEQGVQASAGNVRSHLQPTPDTTSDPKTLEQIEYATESLAARPTTISATPKRLIDPPSRYISQRSTDLPWTVPSNLESIDYAGIERPGATARH